MKYYNTTESDSKEGFVHLYQEINQEDLMKKAEEVFITSDYKIISENSGEITFEKGNRTMRILFGAFVKYFKFQVRIEATDEGQLKLHMKRATTGMSGGLIGMNQVTKEIERLSALFKEL